MSHSLLFSNHFSSRTWCRWAVQRILQELFKLVEVHADFIGKLLRLIINAYISPELRSFALNACLVGGRFVVLCIGKCWNKGIITLSEATGANNLK